MIFFRVFGCACFPYLRPYNNNKMEFRSKSCVFIGYSLNHHCYQCLDRSSGRIYLSRHVLFDEQMFPFRETIAPLPAPTISDPPLILDSTTSPVVLPSPPPNPPPPNPLPSTTAISSSLPLSINPSSSSLPMLQPPDMLSVLPGHNQRSSSFVDPVSSRPMQTRSTHGIHKPNPKYAMVVSASPTVLEPTCFSQAIKHVEWRDAMAAEFNALQVSGTWSLVPPQHSMNVLPNKWVFRIKRKSDGSIERYKARLVANGFHQQEGIDYAETFSPVVKHTTIRIVIALAIHFKWSIRQLDVQNAFLHGYISEEVYMRQPAGFIDNQFPHYVCKLHRSLYGLKQAPRAWFQCFSDYLLELGFIESLADYSLFTYNHNDVFLILLIYVDDILITGNSPDCVTKLILQLSKLFSMKDLGPLHYFLGIEVVHQGSQVYLTQSKYALDLLCRTKFQDVKPLSSPVAHGKRLSVHDVDILDDPSEYRSVVGALQYLTITRPDLAFAVNQVCQFMHRPTNSHWMAVKRILRFVKSTYDHGLVYSPGTLNLQAFSDADYAGDPDERRYTGGYCIYLGTNLISWSSKKHGGGISRSSTEAEYRQLALTASELSWLRALFRDLHVALSPPRLWCDNVSAISLASNPVFHSRTKHVEVDYHYIRDKVVRREISVGFVCSEDQLADIFTKGLHPKRFKLLASKLPVRSRPVTLRGCNKQLLSSSTSSQQLLSFCM